MLSAAMLPALRMFRVRVCYRIAAVLREVERLAAIAAERAAQADDVRRCTELPAADRCRSRGARRRKAPGGIGCERWRA